MTIHEGIKNQVLNKKVQTVSIIEVDQAKEGESKESYQGNATYQNISLYNEQGVPASEQLIGNNVSVSDSIHEVESSKDA